MNALEIINNSEFFAVAHDAEVYKTAECMGHTIIETWKEFMFYDPDQAPEDEVLFFKNFAEDGDNWHDIDGHVVLEYPIGGESGGTITFYKKVHK